MIDSRQCLRRIAEVLLPDFISVYYVDIETDEYVCFFVSPDSKSLEVKKSGDDFFCFMSEYSEAHACAEDLHIFKEDLQKEKLLSELEVGKGLAVVYRINVDGKLVYHQLRINRDSHDGEEFFVLGVQNVEERIRERKLADRTETERDIYNQIVESLAAKYDVIYYVDPDSGKYSEFRDDPETGSLDIKEKSGDFFEDSIADIEMLIFPQDRFRMRNIVEKNNLLSLIAGKKSYSVDYRLVVEGKIQNTRMTIAQVSDRNHIVIGVINIDEEVARERARVNAINSANERATRDELTGANNKNAYGRLEEELQEKIDNGLEPEICLVVCDLNNLKLVNDSMGHKAGDEYIKSLCQLLSDTFPHSYVYRIGGDEFVVYLRKSDCRRRIALFDKIKKQICENKATGDGPVAAVGMAVFDPSKDEKVTDVFDRADNMMYLNKRELKGEDDQTVNSESDSQSEIDALHKAMLDSLFDAFSVVAEGSYVFICDMKYDYSRWSKTAVDTFELPSEYMYNAGAIWEEKIHPDDRAAYAEGINAVFTGSSEAHDMQYRARRPSGKYDVCTCRGLVMRNQQGIPTYFAGVIRNHGMQGNMDSLTGLRNQNGFFDDLRRNMSQGIDTRLFMIGIRRFSDINEIYGYDFGNSVLQKLGRIFFERLGNRGSLYRLDGTRFVVMTNVISVSEMRVRYEEMRSFCRRGFEVEGRSVVLELNAGAISIDHFSIDEKTIYSCLQYAYNESKYQRQGDLIEFQNAMNEEDRVRIEKIHSIRASISRGCKGFYLLYQPVVDADNEYIKGMEALLRWKDEDGKVVPPDLFIPILENDPLFPELGKWILKEALLAAKPILEYRPDFTVNVNLSYSQIERADFLDTVFSVVREIGVPNENICLEITERCRLLDMELLKNVVVNLRGKGIKVALDDFGTGFASVGLLKDITFDIIKIDRSFVLHVDRDRKEQALVDSFSSLAESFGTKICVEGIENAAMREVLINYNVQSFQGYYYSRPVEIDEIIDKIKAEGGE